MYPQLTQLVMGDAILFHTEINSEKKYVECCILEVTLIFCDECTRLLQLAYLFGMWTILPSFLEPHISRTWNDMYRKSAFLRWKFISVLLFVVSILFQLLFNIYMKLVLFSAWSNILFEQMTIFWFIFGKLVSESLISCPGFIFLEETFHWTPQDSSTTAYCK